MIKRAKPRSKAELFVTTTCGWCGKPVTRRKKNDVWGKQHYYCDTSCSTKGRRKRAFDEGYWIS